MSDGSWEWSHLSHCWGELLRGTRCSAWPPCPTRSAPGTSPSAAPQSARRTQTCGCSWDPGSSSPPESSSSCSLICLDASNCKVTEQQRSAGVHGHGDRRIAPKRQREGIKSNPFTKVSDNPAAFMAIKLFASLIRTCSSPPSTGTDFFAEWKRGNWLETARITARGSSASHL